MPKQFLSTVLKSSGKEITKTIAKHYGARVVAHAWARAGSYQLGVAHALNGVQDSLGGINE